jgi:P27 family predicted phage terminase small subunit
MGPGRPATPTALKKLQGTFRADRSVKNEMMPALLEYAPSAPPSLPKDGRKVWDSVCDELIRMQMLHRVDLELLAAYCNEIAAYWDAQKMVKKQGSVLTLESKNGPYTKQNDWVAIRNTALKNAQGLANQFGFTPSARARINFTPPDPTDPLEDLLNS